MTTNDKLHGQDKDGDTWEVDTAERKDGAVAIIGAIQRDVGAWAALDHVSAVRAGIRLLEAAKVDIVGAAWRVEEARAEVLRLQDLDGDDSDAGGYFAAKDELDKTLDVLAAELAKLDAMVGHDMSEAREEK